MILIALAGVGAGAINAVVGSGTLITFPTLVALGYPPVTSTMSNAVGLVAGGVSGTWGYRRELRGQWKRLRWQIPASLIGAIMGAWLLLHLPEKVFVTVVPILLILALVLVLVGPRIQAWARKRAEASGNGADHVSTRRMVAVVLGTWAVGIYGGYFTAAQGVMLVGVLGLLLSDPLQRLNGIKNVLSSVVNVVAGLVYAFVAPISWPVVGILAVSSIVGGVIGSKVGRKLPPLALRIVIIVIGLAAVVHLIWF